MEMDVTQAPLAPLISFYKRFPSVLALPAIHAFNPTKENGSMSMTKSEIEQKVISVLNEMTQDWDLDSAEGIKPQTGLMNDLEFESIDIVQLAVAMEQNFNQKGLPFEQLFMHDGDYVDEIHVSEVVDFMHSNMNA